jgi:O-methyltransferase involved in polyketide biosynthesis
MGAGNQRIGPTAHYTSYVWFRHGLSHEGLATPLGRRLYWSLWPVMSAYRRLQRRADLEATLLARHRVIDHLLDRAVASGAVGQVIEVAAGLSPRGFTFAERYADRDLLYVEGDLGSMARAKRERLARAGLGGSNHLVVELDALIDDGPTSLAAVARSHLRPDRPLALITEGLTGYLPRSDLEAMWQRFARCLAGFGGGVYLADLPVGGESSFAAAALGVALGALVGSRVYAHYRDVSETELALHRVGFASATLHAPSNVAGLDIPGRGHVIRVIEAGVSAP